ncbi:MAG: hypothetical protein ACRDWI_08780 [Jiangellaceae bacterium]
MNTCAKFDGRRAGAVLAVRLGDSIDLIDPGGGPEQLHDFDIVGPHGRVAVEVTRFTRPNANEQDAAVRKQDQPVHGLASTWVVGCGTRFSVKKTRTALVPLLNSLDELGIRSVTPDDDQVPVKLRDELQSLGVRYVDRVGGTNSSTSGRILLNSEGSIGAADADLLADVIEECAGRPDNLRKLNVTDANARHLFVWVDRSCVAHYVALWGDVVPARMPYLPDVIDCVWLASASQPTVIWSYSRGEGWSNTGVAPG